MSVVRMPEVITGMTEAVINQWFVKPGQDVAVGQLLAEAETEKATVEFSAEQAGTLLEYLVELDQPITVGTPIARLSGGDDSADEAEDAGGAEDAAEVADVAPVAAAAATATPRLEVHQVGATEAADVRRFASPIARRLAREMGVALEDLQGTGPGGRIVRRDLERARVGLRSEDVVAPSVVSTAVPAAAETRPSGLRGVEIPHTGMRRAIARRLTESKTTIPHFYLTADCQVDALLAFRRQLNEQAGSRISVTDLVVKAAAGAFVEVPEANAIWTDDATLRFDHVDIAVAVAQESGLVTPVVRDVERTSVGQLSRDLADLIERGRAGRLKQHELEGGVLSISNLGMFGIERFAAIINPPQSGILAVGAATERPVVRDGQLAVATVMTVTYSGDHRVLDGALGARWLGAFVRRIENPLSILL